MSWSRAKHEPWWEQSLGKPLHIWYTATTTVSKKSVCLQLTARMEDVTGAMTRSARDVHERLTSRTSQGNAEQRFKTDEGPPCVGKGLLVTNARKNKGGAFSDDREYVSDVNAS